MQEVEGDDGGSETPYNRPHLTGSHLYRQFNPSGPTLTHLISFGFPQAVFVSIIFEIKSTFWGSTQSKTMPL